MLNEAQTKVLYELSGHMYVGYIEEPLDVVKWLIDNGYIYINNCDDEIDRVPVVFLTDKGKQYLIDNTDRYERHQKIQTGIIVV